jgi:uroporphyrin-III C-methyltransferase
VQCSLIASGLPAATQVVVVQDASLPRERQLRTILSRLADDVIAHDIGSPAIMVIGEVARERGARQPELQVLTPA